MSQRVMSPYDRDHQRLTTRLILIILEYRFRTTPYDTQIVYLR